VRMFGFVLAWYFSQVRKLFGDRKPPKWQVFTVGAAPILIAIILLAQLSR